MSGSLKISIVCVVVVLASLPVVLHTQSIGGGFRMENLDLPYDSNAHLRYDEEANIVQFYGANYETDAIFFCLDQSMSMGRGQWEALQRELARVVTQFSTNVEFGIVFFHAETTAFPPNKRPAKATKSMKAAAIQMVKSTSASNKSTCVLAGLTDALTMANRSSVERRSIVFMSDGKATCAGEDPVGYIKKTFSQTRNLNSKRIPIHTVGIGFEVIEYFLKKISNESGGSYRRLTK